MKKLLCAAMLFMAAFFIPTNINAEDIVYDGYTVTIPTSIAITNGTTTGYDVSVRGNIPPSATVTVVPDDMIVMSQQYKNDVTAYVYSDVTEWSSAEVIAGDKKASLSITAEGMSAGVWEGSLNFTISYNLQPGLYAENDVLLCSWEDSGIDIEKDYLYYSGGNNYYATDTTSSYYVITNYYPDTVKAVLPNNISRIGNYGFCGCKTLKEVILSDSIESIGNSSFSGL